MDNRWTDYLAGARMQVDQEFSKRVRASEFTNQQWGLIMTAVEFEIHDPADPERAELVANTDNVEAIMPELDAIERRSLGPGGADDSGGSLFDRIRGYFSSDSEGDDQQYEQAVALVDEYTTQLQERLREEGRWQELCTAAAEAERANAADQ